MTTFQALSKVTHAQQRLKRYSDYAFAAADHIAPLTHAELPKACMQLPIAFLQHEGSWQPFALQGVLPGKNLLVAPNGKWVGGYVPALYRGYPFAVLPNEQSQLVLCVNTDSGLISDTEGEALFTPEGNPTKVVTDILEFLTQIAQAQAPTRAVCQALADHNLLQPWPITVQTDEGAKNVAGLWRVDEAALGKLEASALQQLQQQGALAVAYMQLLSMQHLSALQALAQAHAQVAQQQAQASAALPVTAQGDLDLEFLNQDGTISLSGL